MAVGKKKAGVVTQLGRKTITMTPAKEQKEKEKDAGRPKADRQRFLMCKEKDRQLGKMISMEPKTRWGSPQSRALVPILLVSNSILLPGLAI